MPSVGPLAGNEYIVRVWKKQVGAVNAKPWCNTYEIDYAGGVLDIGNATAIADGLVALERLLHLELIEFDHVTISTWQPDSKPYDPDALFTIPGSGVLGNREIGVSRALPTTNTYNIRRNAVSGRNGKLSYRGCLLLSDVEFGIDKYALKDASPLSPNADPLTAVYDNFVDGLVNVAANGGFNWIMVGEPQTSLIYHAAAEGEKQVVEKVYGAPVKRGVFSFQYQGLSLRDIDAAWFDRP